MEEKTLLQESGVTITTARAVLGATTYPIAQITSVSTTALPASKAPAVLAALLGLCCILPGIGMTNAQGERADPVWLGIGAVLVAIAVVLWVATKDRFAVVLSTAGLQANAVVSRDKSHVARVAVALNEAIVQRAAK